MSLSINPFHLETMSRALNAPNQTVLQRSVGALQGGLYDLYVKNPYDMTVGNLQNFGEKPLSERVGRAAIASFAAAYSLILYGVTGFFASASLHSLGIALSSPSLVALAKKVQDISEIVFLCGSVPLYAVLYALPKKICTTLPPIIAKTVSSLASFLFNNVIFPITKGILHAITFTTRQIVVIGDTLAKGIAWISTAVKEVAVAIGKAACRVFVRSMIAIAKGIVALGEGFLAGFKWVALKIAWISTAVKEVAVAVGKAACRVFVRSMIAIAKGIAALGEGFLAGFKWVAQNIGAGLITLSSKIGEVAYTIFTSIGTAVKQLAAAIAWVGRSVVSLIQGIGAQIKYLAILTEKAAQCVFNYTLVPLWNWVIVPIAQAIARSALWIGTQCASAVRATMEAAQWVFNHTLAPLWNRVVVPFAALVDVAARRVANAVYEVSASALQKIATSWTYMTTEMPRQLSAFFDRFIQTLQANFESAFQRIQGVWERVYIYCESID